MRQAERGIEQLHVILRYCERLSAASERFGNSYQAFCEDVVFQDSCSLCIIQMGEAASR